MPHAATSPLAALLGAALLALAPPASRPSHAPDRGDDAVTLDVRFRLTDPDDAPIANAPVRIVFGSDPAWQRADAGTRFVTDARGEHRFTTTATLDRRLKKYATNFVTQLLSLPRRTDHLSVGAELEYGEFRWLYVLELYRFPEERAVALDGFAIYARDGAGDFTRRAAREGDGWRIAELGGSILTSPGNEPSNFQLHPDPSDPTGRRWTLELSFKRAPPPVRR